MEQESPPREGNAEEARALVESVRERASRLTSMPGQVVLGVSAALRAVHLLEQLTNAHERGDSELEAMALRVILETYISGRYALHADDSDAIRWSVDHDQSRRRLAERHGRADVVSAMDAEGAELEAALGRKPKGLPSLDQMIELLPDGGAEIGRARDLLYGPLSDWHMHAGGGAIGRYSTVDDGRLSLIPEPPPVIAAPQMLAIAIGLTGALMEDAFTVAET